MRNFYNEIKRKVASLLVVVMTLQTVLTGTAPGVAWAEEGENPWISCDVSSVNPTDAFDDLKVLVAPYVTTENSIHVALSGGFDNGWINQKYETFLEECDEALDEADFDSGEPIIEGGPAANTEFDSYDAYLESIDEEWLPRMAFSFTIDKDLLDDSMLNAAGEMKDDSDKAFGTWKITEDSDGNYRLTASIEQWIYYRDDRKLGLSADLILKEYYNPGTEIETGDNLSGADVDLNIGSGETASVSNSEYSLKKRVEVEGDTKPDNVVLDGREFSYVLTATTSNYQSMSILGREIVGEASGSNWSMSASELEDYIPDEEILSAAAGLASPSIASPSETDELNSALDLYEDDYGTYGSAKRSFWYQFYVLLSSDKARATTQTDANLTGTWIRDSLPAGLELVSVEARAEKGQWTPLTDAYSFNENVLSYQIADGLTVTADQLDWFELRVNVRLSDALYEEHMIAGGTHTYAFPNRAFLKTEEDGDNLAISNRVNPSVKMNAGLEKDGGKLDTTDGTLKWTLTVNSMFGETSGVQLWAVDYIEDCSDTHTFDPTKNVVFEDGKVLSIETIGAALPYDEIKSVKQIEEILGTEYESAGNSKKAYMYTYDADGAGTADKLDAVLLIPLYPDHLDGKTTITYSTKLGDDLLKDPSKYGQSIDFRNEANIMWKWPEGGTGPNGEMYSGSATIEKNVSSTLDVLSKSAGEYAAETNTLPWSMEINHSHVHMTNAIVWDVFQNDELSLKKENPIYLEWDNTKTQVMPGTTGSAVPYYTYEESRDSSVLTVYLGDLLARGAQYQLTFDTEVKDIVSASADSQIQIKNTGHMSGTVGDQEISNIIAEASTSIENTLIQKTAVPLEGTTDSYYDYANHTILWNVKINPRKASISDASVTDTLPEGLLLKNLIDVTENPDEKEPNAGNRADFEVSTETGKKIWKATIGSKEITCEEPDPDSAPDSFTVSFGDIDTAYEFTFETELTEAYRRNLETGKRYDIVNTATLKGTYGDVDIETSDSDKAPVIFNPLSKSGTYQKPEMVTEYKYIEADGSETTYHNIPVLSWDLYVNRTGINIAGASIEDWMANESTGDEFMELVPASVKVYEVELNADGTEKKEKRKLVASGQPNSGSGIYQFAAQTGYSALDSESTCAAEGFAYKISGTAAYHKTLLFAFDTLLSDDVKAVNMKNSASIKGANLKDDVTSPKAEGASDFFTANYSSATGVYFVKLHKISANQHNSGSAPLKGARFKLETMEFAEGDRTDLSAWNVNENIAAKYKKSNKRGNLSFLFLKKDTMYRITEEEAPIGYTVSNNTWYYVPHPVANGSYPAEVLEIDAAKKDPNMKSGEPDHTYTLRIQKDPEQLSYLLDDVENEVTPVDPGKQAAEISFTKTGQNGQLLDGVWFSLTHNTGKFSTRYAMSGAEQPGVVKFDDVDILLKSSEYYTIQEMTELPPDVPGAYTALAGYEPWKGSVRVRVTWDADTLQFVISYPDPNDTVFDYDKHSLTNEAYTKSGQFKKIDQNKDAVEGITFAVSRLGDGGTEDPESSGKYTVIMNPAEKNEYKQYLPNASVQSGADGTVKLENFYYGFYKLEEQDNRKVLKKAEPIYLYVNEKGIYTLPKQPADDTAAIAQPANAYTVSLSDTSKPYTVSNELKWGYVQVNKMLGRYKADQDGNYVAEPALTSDDKRIFLKDMMFEIYRAVPDGNKETKPDTTVYMRVKTGADGRFLMDSANSEQYQNFSEAGTQVGLKHLVCGDYYLKEVQGSNSIYVANDTYYPFTIAAGEERDEVYQPAATVYVGSDGTTSTANDIPFLNQPKRQPVTLTKVDSYYQDLALPNAEFAIYDNKIQNGAVVAKLVYVDSSLTYQLEPSETEVISEDAGVPYLGRLADGQYALLPGEYRVVETKAPALSGDGLSNIYKQPAANGGTSAILTVSSTGTALSLSKGQNGLEGSAGTRLVNTTKSGSITIDKSVMLLDSSLSLENAAAYHYDTLAGFEFVAYMRRAQAGAAGAAAGIPTEPTTEKYTGTSRADGKIEFNTLPAGSYRLVETNVPENYRYTQTVNGQPVTKWMVERVPDVYFKVEPKDAETNDMKVTFYTDDTFQTVLTLKPDSVPVATPSQIYRTDSESPYGLAAYNAMKQGTVIGRKLAVDGAGAEMKTAGLGNAEITLTHNNTALKYVFKTKTADDGSFEFSNIPYGSYTLTESGVPAGYEKISEQIILVDETTLQNGVLTLADLNDKVIKVNAKFRKTDQNGNGLNGVPFTVTQTKTVVDGSVYAYGDARKQVHVSTGTGNEQDGILFLQNLSYGTYHVKEDESYRANLDDGAKLAEFWLKVDKGSTEGTSKITVYKDDPDATRGLAESVWAAITGEDQEVASSENVRNGGTVAFVNSTEMNVVMTNILQYGYVALTKVRGELTDKRDKKDIYTAYEDDKLTGVTFEIYKDNVLYLTLKTENGKLPDPDQTGKYTDARNPSIKKALLAGTYMLKEVEHAGYTAIADIPFTVGSQTCSTFYTDSYNVATVSNAAAAGSQTLMNIPARGTLSFEKVDYDHPETKLKEAVFAVENSDGTQVAKVIWRDETENYQLMPMDGGMAAVDTMTRIPYLAGSDSVGYSLLQGNYTLKEITTPTGYLADYNTNDTDIAVTIEAGKNTVVTGNSVVSGQVTNRIQKADIQVIKSVESNAYKPGADGTGFRFMLVGTPSNGDTWTAEVKTSTALTGSSNKGFRITDIPLGRYALYELAVAGKTEAYQGFDHGAEVKLLDITITADASGTPKVGYTRVGSTDITVAAPGSETTEPVNITNNWKKGSITGTKWAVATASDGVSRHVPLKGVRFALYADETALTPIAADSYLATTDAYGKFTFSNVPYGTYYVGEYSVPEGYIMDTGRQRVTVSQNGQEVTVGNAFVNERYKGTVQINKVSADEVSGGKKLALHGAEFTVYVNKGTAANPSLGVNPTAVAYLTEDARTGIYKLTDTNAKETQLNEWIPGGRTDAGLPYLEKVNGVFYLVNGEYVVAETTTPTGYQPDAALLRARELIAGELSPSLLKLHALSIGTQIQDQIWYLSNVDQKLDQATVFTNSRSLTDIPVTKLVETPTYHGADQTFTDPTEAFRFEITGTLADGTSLNDYLISVGRSSLIANGVVTITTAQGIAQLSDIPAGSYTIKEVVADSKAYRYQPKHADNAERTVDISFRYNTARQQFDAVASWSNAALNGTFKNHLKRGAVEGRKVAANNPSVGLAGAKFGLFTNATAVAEADAVMIATSSDAQAKRGTFVFTDVPYGTYYVRELKAPSGYAPSTMVYTVVVNEHGTTYQQGEVNGVIKDIVFENGNKRADVQLIKRDATSKDLLKIQAEFTIYNTEKEAVAYLTDPGQSGIYRLATSGNAGAADIRTTETPEGISYLQKDDATGKLMLIQGTYIVVETKTPDGYLTEYTGKNRKEYTFVVPSEDDSTAQNVGTVMIYNSGDDTDKSFYNATAQTGFTLDKQVEITRADLSKADETADGEGFIFRISGREDTVLGRQVSEIDTLRIDGKPVSEATNANADPDDPAAILVTTKADGKVVFTGLPIGVYTITEVDKMAGAAGRAYEDYKINAARTVYVTQKTGSNELEVRFDRADGDPVDPSKEKLEVLNTLQRYDIAGKKIDGKGAALAGAIFGLYPEGGSTPYRTELSDENGEFRFTAIPTGKYQIKEVTPAAGYLPIADVWDVEVTGETTESSKVVPVTVGDTAIVNTLIHGFAELDKMDPENSDYVFRQVEFTLYDAENDRKIGKLKQEIGTNHFTLATSSDAVLNDNQDPYLIWDDTEQKTGLIYGAYYVVETGCEEGYLADLDADGKPVKHTFEIRENGRLIVVETNGKAFENKKARGSFEVTKEKEVVGEHVFQSEVDKAAGEGFIFRISWKDMTTGHTLAGEDIRDFAVVTGAAAVVKGSGANPWIEVTTDGDGTFKLDNLLAGEYTIEELQKDGVTDAYVPASMQIITVTVDQKTNKVEAPNAEFLNLLKRSSIQGQKITSAGAPLAGATMGLFPAGTTEFTEANLFYGMTAVSDADGRFTFERIPYGTYRVAELSAPSGYQLNRTTSYLVTVTADGAAIRTGIPEERGTATAETEAAIAIVNIRRSSSGGGGGNPPSPTNPTEPGSPGPGELPTEPANPENPTNPTAPADPSGPANPEVPGVPTDPDIPTIPIPFDPENPVVNIPGEPPEVVIDGPNGETVYRGSGTDVNVEGWEPGTYTIYTFDENGIPLSKMTMYIDENGIPLAFILPKTGDHSMPYALLAALMLGALGGMGLLVYRKKKEQS